MDRSVGDFRLREAEDEARKARQAVEELKRSMDVAMAGATQALGEQHAARLKALEADMERVKSDRAAAEAREQSSRQSEQEVKQRLTDAESMIHDLRLVQDKIIEEKAAVVRERDEALMASANAQAVAKAFEDVRKRLERRFDLLCKTHVDSQDALSRTKRALSRLAGTVYLRTFRLRRELAGMYCSLFALLARLDSNIIRHALRDPLDINAAGGMPPLTALGVAWPFRSVPRVNGLPPYSLSGMEAAAAAAAAASAAGANGSAAGAGGDSAVAAAASGASPGVVSAAPSNAAGKAGAGPAAAASGPGAAAAAAGSLVALGEAGQPLLRNVLGPINVAQYMDSVGGGGGGRAATSSSSVTRALADSRDHKSADDAAAAGGPSADDQGDIDGDITTALSSSKGGGKGGNPSSVQSGAGRRRPSTPAGSDFLSASAASFHSSSAAAAAAGPMLDRVGDRIVERVLVIERLLDDLLSSPPARIERVYASRIADFIKEVRSHTIHHSGYSFHVHVDIFTCSITPIIAPLPCPPPTRPAAERDGAHAAAARAHGRVRSSRHHRRRSYRPVVQNHRGLRPRQCRPHRQRPLDQRGPGG